MEKWQTDSCPAINLKMTCDEDLDFDLPKTKRGLKKTRLHSVVWNFCEFSLIIGSVLTLSFSKMTIPKMNPMIAKKHGVMTTMHQWEAHTPLGNR